MPTPRKRKRGPKPRPPTPLRPITRSRSVNVEARNLEADVVAADDDSVQTVNCSTVDCSTVVDQHCCNCKRRDVSLVSSCVKGVAPNTKHFHINKKALAEDKVCLLCQSCKIYLIDQDKTDSYWWSAFVWSVLKDSIQCCRAMWKLLPPGWRCWWTDAVHMHYSSEVLDLSVQSFTVDATEEYNSFHSDMKVSALNKLSWVQFVQHLESSIVIPKVRCPWGCCDTIAKSKLFPFNLFVQHYIPKKLIPQDSKFCFRNDICTNSTKILYKWPCCVTYSFSKGVPYVLTC